MANSHFFEAPQSNPSHCVACQALLADAVDGCLGEIDRAWFDRHVDTCAECGDRFADAQRGAAWLDVLKSAAPEPSVDLVARILSETTSPAGIERTPWLPSTAAIFSVPTPSRRRPAAAWIQPPHVLFEPRLALTAAMALFSLALTMNLTGVELSQLRPSSLRRTYYRSVAGVSRYYDNLRVVHVLESRVEDLREANSDSRPSPDPTPKATPARPHSAPRQKKTSPEGNGVSRRQSPWEPPFDVPRILNAEAKASSSKVGGLA